jgi:phosphotransferase system HPr (HPr) family protein
VTEGIEREFTVRSEVGLHARPAALFSELARKFECEIEVGRGGEWVDGRSILSLMSLGAKTGSRLRIRASGPDAEQAIEALGAFLENPEPSPPR